MSKYKLQKGKNTRPNEVKDISKKRARVSSFFLFLSHEQPQNRGVGLSLPIITEPRNYLC